MSYKWCILIVSIVFVSCSETVDINAPYKDVWVVYGVLNPAKKSQAIRISKAFQSESNAYEYAANHDLSIKGLQVSLHGAGQTYQAIQIDSVPKDQSGGDFGPFQTIYVFETDVARLEAGAVYELRIQSESDPGLHLSARTRIPPYPKLLYPTVLGNFSDRCLAGVPFEDSVQVIFRTHAPDQPGRAMGYEIRWFWEYTRNGEPQTFRYGPTKLFSSSVSCRNSGNGILCFGYTYAQILDEMGRQLNDPFARYEIPTDTLCGTLADLSDALTVELTAVDTNLGLYMTANDPAGQGINFNTYRREFTNIEGTAQSLGVFGAITTDKVPVTFTDCGKYLLRLDTTSTATDCGF